MASTSGVTKGRGIWLVGGTLESITGCKLPSNKQVLGRFFHLHSCEKKTIQSSAATTAKEICTFWEKAKIPTKKECHIIDKIKGLHLKWQNMKKSASRRTPQQIEKESSFTSVFDDLFDIAHADALTLITIPEDREFLLAQREKGRRGSMGPVDTTLAKKEERVRKRVLQNESRKEKETERAKKEAEVVNICEYSDSEDDHSNSSKDSDLTYESTSAKRLKEGNTSSTVKSSKPSSVVNPEVASALDRTKMSDRNAVYVLSATAISFGHNPQDLVLNRESIRKSRREYREKIANEVKASFHPTIPLTVHWDGKLLPALMSKDKVDRLAVIVSGEGVMKLLGIPQIPNGTGEAQAAAVFNLIEEWHLTERIQFMCFDTTASNSGVKAGACVLLEKKFDRQLIHLACRHHILELIVESVFNALMGATSGPNIQIFKRFSDNWSKIDKAAYQSGIIEDCVAQQLNPFKNDIIKFIKDQLKTFQPRDDYKELLQLALLFLGENDVKQINIHAPGALHRARWMAKLIYSIKIYLFRSQFKLTAQELSKLRVFNVFVLQIYLQYWYTSPSAAVAPYNDLKLLKELDEYRKTNKVIADAAAKSFSGHLWYLSETLVGFSFFDPEVSSEMKGKMVKSLEKKGTENPPRRVKVDATAIQRKQLCDFVTQNTLNLFTALEITQDFLNDDPSTWENNQNYLEGREKVKKLKIVNDAAERGIALIQSFNGIITNQEEQKQFLLQVIEKHRNAFPNPNKSTIVAQNVP